MDACPVVTRCVLGLKDIFKVYGGFKACGLYQLVISFGRGVYGAQGLDECLESGVRMLRTWSWEISSV